MPRTMCHNCYFPCRENHFMLPIRFQFNRTPQPNFTRHRPAAISRRLRPPVRQSVAFNWNRFLVIVRRTPLCCAVDGQAGIHGFTVGAPVVSPSSIPAPARNDDSQSVKNLITSTIGHIGQGGRTHDDRFDSTTSSEGEWITVWIVDG